jgi:hypothetical protein
LLLATILNSFYDFSYNLLLGIKDLAKKYMGGSGVIWSDNKLVEAFLLTQGVDENGFKFFKEVQTGLELFVEGNKLIRAYQHYPNNRELKEELLNLPISSWEDHKVFFLEKSNQGTHIIGGELPKELKLPTHLKLKTPFQFIGTIDCTDKYFNWLRISKFHIIYPTFECSYGVFLDYSNPNEPQIVDPVNFSPAWYEDGLEKIHPIYTATRYITTDRWDPEKIDRNDQLQCGVPLWIQAPGIPKNPQTGKVMKYVCTICSDKELKISNYKDEVGPFRSNYLIFADVGRLYVFFDPETKTAHLQIQF